MFNWREQVQVIYGHQHKKKQKWSAVSWNQDDSSADSHAATLTIIKQNSALIYYKI